MSPSPEQRFADIEADTELLFRAAEHTDRELSSEIDALHADDLLLAKTLNVAVNVLADKLNEHEDRIAKLAQAEELYAPEQVSVEDELSLDIAVEQVVAFKYRDAEGVTSYRVVSPYEVKTVQEGDGYELLLGWDHGREGIRHFRIERIEGVPTATDAEDFREPDAG